MLGLHTLEEKKVLEEKGWSHILDAIKCGQPENKAFSHISKIAATIAQHIHQTKGMNATTKIENTPHDLGTPEVSSHAWFPDIRSGLIESQTIDSRTLRPDSADAQRLREAYSNMQPENKDQLQVPQPVELSEPRSNARVDSKSEREQKPKTKMNLSDIVAVGEVKRGEFDPDIRDNESKVCGGATELLYNDPCRRFVSGFTIEGRWMRMWRFERSHVCVSEKFDFHEKPKPFLKFLLYILFSSPQDLGFDPTVRRYIKRVPKGVDPPSSGASSYRYEIAYRYQVGQKFFLTEGPPISEEAAYWVASRATRVWRVREMFFPNPGDETVYTLGDLKALKDAYLFDDAVLEKDIRNQIMKSLEGVAEVNIEDAARYFMDYELDEVVRLPSENEKWVEDDLTSCTDANKRAFYTPDSNGRALNTLPESQRTSTSQRDSNRPTPTDSQASASGGQTKPAETYWDNLQYHRRKHVRTVFSQVCQSIYELDNWTTLMRCMGDLTKGLNYMRLAGWVHRDISGGNCLWDPEAKQGKLADLEYARPYKHSSRLPHDPRTGTPAFMAVEYQRREYLYTTRIGDVSLAALWNNDDNDSDEVSAQRLAFTYHFYHDLESLIWLYAWAVCFRPPRCLSPESVESIAKTLRVAGSRYFNCGVEGNQARVLTVKDGVDTNFFITQPLLDIYTKGSRCRFLLSGSQMVRPLAHEYRRLQSLQLDDKLLNGTAIWNASNFTEALYNAFLTMFNQIEEEMKRREDVFPMHHISSRWDKTTKRTRAEDPDTPTKHASNSHKRAKKATDRS